VVLVGDPQQLQSIEAGAAFRWVHERHGGAEFGGVRRQRDVWRRAAVRDLATFSISTAMHACDRHGMVQEAQTRGAI
jgi:ATP-dependent exoDNAse (exonuclease V) alpha subunit